MTTKNKGRILMLASTFLILGLIGVILAYDFICEDTDGPNYGSVSWSKAWVKAYCNYYMGNPQWWYVAARDHGHWWYIDPGWQGDWQVTYSWYPVTPPGGLNMPAWSKTIVKIYSLGAWRTDSSAHAQAP